MNRFIVFDRQSNPLFDLKEEEIISAYRTEVINGEHKLEIETTRILEEGMRILIQDHTGKWREWVIDEPDETHNEDGMVGLYGCTWSLQYDLSTVDGGELWPGTYSPISARNALAMVLAKQSRWELGEVTLPSIGGTTLYDGSVWEYLGKLQSVWGGEIDSRIVVSDTGILHRYVMWYSYIGSQSAVRRFDYGHDCTEIKRTPSPGPRYCRVVPRGGNDATDSDGISYSNRVGIQTEPASSGDGWIHNNKSKWIRDPDAEQLFRIPDGKGGWIYPEKVVIYDTDDPEELLQKASSEVHQHTRPEVTYEASVIQFAAAGMDAHGVQLGDRIHIVDRMFGDTPLRLESRIFEMRVNELDDTDIELTIGDVSKGIEASFKSMVDAVNSALDRSRKIEGAGTLVYLQTLLDQLNTEINATGGYSYVVKGQGLITYDKAVADPLIGIEATSVTQIKGGSIRIANSKKPQFSGIEDWEWKTVFVSGHIAAELVTAVNVVTGWLGNNDGTFIDLDNNTANFGPVNGYHFTVNTSGIKYWYGNTLLGQHLSNSIQLGQSAKEHITITPNGGIAMFDSNNDSTVHITPDVTRIGKLNNSRIYVRPGSIESYDSDNKKNMSISSNGIELSNKDLSHIVLRDSELEMSGSMPGGLSIKTDKSNFYRASVIDSVNQSTGIIVANRLKYAAALGIVAVCIFENYGEVAAFSYGTEDTQIIYGEGQGNWVKVVYDGDITFKWYKSNGSTQNIRGYIDYEIKCINHTFTFGTSRNSSFNRGKFSNIFGLGLYASGDFQFSIGSYNTTASNAFSVGNGTESSPRDALHLSRSGDLYIMGTLTQGSDRRLKTHHKYLSDDACEFIRSLKPALYTKNGIRSTGFYAQDVQEAEPEGWDTSIVTAQHVDESLDYDPLTLDYNALIAPLVTYAQHLERRIDEQQEVIESLKHSQN